MKLAPMAALIVFTTCALAVGPAGTAAADVPAADALRAKIAAAAGEQAFVETAHRTVSGVEGTATIYRSGADFREVDIDGGLHAEFGRYQHQDWHQNANGQTVLDQPGSEAAATGGFTSSVAVAAAPPHALVLSRLDSGGDGTKEYVDPVTFAVLRREVIAPAETTVFTYDDFRTVDGHTAAWHWTRRDGHAENDADYRVTSFVTRPITGAEIGIPPPRRALVEFPAGKTSVELPVRMIGDGGAFAVHVVIAGRGYDFLLDSGATGIEIDDATAQEVGLRALRTSTVVVPDMQVGELRMHDVVAQTRPSAAAAPPGANIAGILGFDFIAELHLRLDYENGRATAFSAAEPLPAGANAIAVEVRLGTQRPLTGASVNGVPGERFVIDTGSAQTLTIFNYFARRHPKALGVTDRDAPQYDAVRGTLQSDRYDLTSVDIGKLHLRQFEALVVDPKHNNWPGIDGLIGAELLRYFTVWLAYDDSHVVLVPNANYRNLH